MTDKKGTFTADEAREAFTYSPETGELCWRNTGAKAGRLHHDGYQEVRFRYGYYRAHRIIWLIMMGSFPEKQIDHINGVKTDNRWGNLREATWVEQGQNRGRQSNNTSGVTGVHYDRSSGKWVASIRAKGVRKQLGRRDTRDEAHALYLDAKQRLHTFQPVPREMMQ